MRPVAIFEPEDDQDGELGTLIMGDRDFPDEATTVGPVTRAEAERVAREHGFEFEILH